MTVTATRPDGASPEPQFRTLGCSLAKLPGPKRRLQPGSIAELVDHVGGNMFERSEATNHTTKVGSTVRCAVLSPQPVLVFDQFQHNPYRGVSSVHRLQLTDGNMVVQFLKNIPHSATSIFKRLPPFLYSECFGLGMLKAELLRSAGCGRLPS